MGFSKGKWAERLKAAQASGMTLAGYARRHGINVRRLYEARYQRHRAKAVPTRETSAFVRVKLKPAVPLEAAAVAHHAGAVAPLAMQARLGNGVVLSWMHDATGVPAQANLLHTLAGLPCFG